MDTQTITCPHCGQPFALSEAFRHELEDTVLAKEREHHRKEMAEAAAKAGEKLTTELKTLQEEYDRTRKALDQSQQVELNLRKEKNRLDEDRRTFELEKQRQLDAEREKIRGKALEEAAEKQRLKEKEKDQVIEGLRKSLEEAQRKAEQGSQQLQGEVQELDLEQSLRSAFPGDLIEPIGKGVLGADIRQTIKSPMGVACGTILWESKRTKAWSDGWIGKLKDDVLSDKANIPAIVSETLPEEAKSGIGFREGVWISAPKLALGLAMLLRKSLLDIAKQKKIQENQLTKAEELYGYITSHEFQHQVEAMVGIYRDMQEQITKERVAFERSWKLREMQVVKLMSGVAGLYGSMQGIAGQALPTIKNLDLPDGDGQTILS
jgi:hypothetical protein